MPFCLSSTLSRANPDAFSSNSTGSLHGRNRWEPPAGHPSQGKAGGTASWKEALQGIHLNQTSPSSRVLVINSHQCTSLCPLMAQSCCLDNPRALQGGCGLQLLLNGPSRDDPCECKLSFQCPKTRLWKEELLLSNCA